MTGLKVHSACRSHPQKPWLNFSTPLTKGEKEEEEEGKRTRRIEKRQEGWRRKEERAKKAQSRAEWRRWCEEVREKKRARRGLEERRDEAGGDDPDGWSFEDGGSFSDGSSRPRIVRTGPRCNQTQDFKLCIIPVVATINKMFHAN